VVRIGNVPPELLAEAIITAVRRYGTIRDHTEETRPSGHRNKVGNGIRLITIDLQKPTNPRHMYNLGRRALISYVDQPGSRYVCSGTNRVSKECPRKYVTPITNRQTTRLPWIQMIELDENQRVNKPITPPCHTSGADQPSSS
jgi:hypothetical protein